MISEAQRGALFYLNLFDGYWESLPSQHKDAANGLLKDGLVEKNTRTKRDSYHLTNAGKKALAN